MCHIAPCGEFNVPMGVVIGGGHTCMEKFRVNGVGLGVKGGWEGISKFSWF